ncbi:cathepsin D [Malassezia vespertilionis]|uniref:Pep1p n=1 Tax=Malassezia vespertilionis TaxID=2020962 RepID=A0A2N1JHK7_9BASI|nr:cathepsin D [Malassezia vespertilionis]PKI86040.1 Pep1p [Malassezia vespertilionis]WFD05267.1 cathepsin D [Malassezia vespertilionis]
MQLSLKFIAGLAATASFALASEGTVVELQRRDSFVSSDDVLNIKSFSAHLNFVNSKYKTALKNFKKNTGKDHPLLRLILDALKRDGTGSVDLEDVNSEQLWAGKMSYGGQSFNIDFDTGSSDTLVNPEAYHPSKSPTSRDTHKTFNVAYGDGTTARGDIYTDNLQIAGLRAKNVAIGRSVTQFITGSEAQRSKGIAGLAFRSIATFQNELPFFDALKQQKAVASGVFQFTLKRGSGSQLNLGGVNAKQFKGNLSFVDVDPSQGFWAADAKVNNRKITAIVDTGSTIISGPMDQVRAVVQGIPGLTPFRNGGGTMYAYNCNKTPKIVISIAGRNFQLGANEAHYGKLSNGQCVLSIQGQENMPLQAWILGDSFLQVASVVFDTDKNRMGFAPQN